MALLGKLFKAALVFLVTAAVVLVTLTVLFLSWLDSLQLNGTGFQFG